MANEVAGKDRALPPKYLENIIWRILPKELRDYMILELEEQYESQIQFIDHSKELAKSGYNRQIRRSFSMPLIAAEFGIPAVTYLSGAGLVPYLIAIGLTVGTLILRDAHDHPADGSLDEMTWDVLIALAITVVVELGLMLFLPTLSLPFNTLIRGAGVNLIGLAAVRFVDRHYRPRPPVGTPEESRWLLLRLLRTTRLTLLMWAIAIFVIEGTNPHVGALDSQLYFGTWAMFIIGYKLQETDLIPMRRSPPTIRPNVDRNAIERLTELGELFVPNSKSTLFECFGFVLLCGPYLELLQLRRSGQPFPAGIDMLQVWTNIAGVALMAAIWILIRNLNRQAAKAVRDASPENPRP